MGVLTHWIMTMSFPARLITLRKQQNYTQQSLTDTVKLHVNQIKRNEAGTPQPTLTQLAKRLIVNLDELVFEGTDCGLDEDLPVQVEALTRFTPEEKVIAKAVLESLILKHDANSFSMIG